MLISNSHKFIYTKTIKTASSTVECYFAKYSEAPTWKILNNSVGFYGHLSAQVVRDKYSGFKKWNEYFKFCVVRNPFERAVSAYFWYCHLWSLEPNDFEGWIFGKYALSIKSNLVNLVDQYLSDKDIYTIDDKFCMDEAIRHENLQYDMEKICRILDIKWEPETIQKLKSGITPNTKYSEIYTIESRKKVEEISSWELNYFNYDFPKK